MQLKKLAANFYLLRNYPSRRGVFFSYEAPIALFDGTELYINETYLNFSATTSKHLNLAIKYCGNPKQVTLSSEEFEELSIDK